MNKKIMDREGLTGEFYDNLEASKAKNLYADNLEAALENLDRVESLLIQSRDELAEANKRVNEVEGKAKAKLAALRARLNK